MANSLASAAADDSYRNRTTRRSKALKATAQGVHQLASSLADDAAQPIERATVRLRLFSSGTQTKRILSVEDPCSKSTRLHSYYVRVRQGNNNNNNKRKCSRLLKPRTSLFCEEACMCTRTYFVEHFSLFVNDTPSVPN